MVFLVCVVLQNRKLAIDGLDSSKACLSMGLMSASERQNIIEAQRRSLREGELESGTTPSQHHRPTINWSAIVGKETEARECGWTRALESSGRNMNRAAWRSRGMSGGQEYAECTHHSWSC